MSGRISELKLEKLNIQTVSLISGRISRIIIMTNNIIDNPPFSTMHLSLSQIILIY